MSRQTFTDEVLCEVYGQVAKNEGTRADVVREIMSRIGMVSEDTNQEEVEELYKKAYNNVNSRVTKLAKGNPEKGIPPVKFPKLNRSGGGRNSQKTVEHVQKLQSILNQ